MNRIFPSIRKMNWDETNSHNLHNPGLILEYGNLMIPLSAGYSDKIQVYRNGNNLLILIINRNLGYVGLDEIDCLDGDITGTVFMQEWQLEESVGKQWFHMKPETLIKRLLEYL